MESYDLLIVALPILLFGLVSARLDASPLSAPMLFTALGLAASPLALDALHFEIGHEILYGIAEITLILILFVDAAQIDLKNLRRFYSLPLRLLGLGLPLCILFGGAAAYYFFEELGLIGALLLAAILAPTDAALGQAVVLNKKVPERIRSSLSVESGFNDGLALPVILILISLAGMMGGMEGGAAYWTRFAAAQVVLGPLMGVLIGWGGGLLIRHAEGGRLMDSAFGQIAILMLALISYAAADVVGGNGFLAAFAAGLAFGGTQHGMKSRIREFAETEGRLLMLLTFFLFGAAFAPDALSHAEPRDLLYALASLTIIRIGASVFALTGTGLRWWTVMFMGWFGPRGLASVLFGLLVVRESSFPGSERIIAVVTLTVLLSIVLHGLSAQMGAAWYARRSEVLTPACPENRGS